MSVVGLHHFAIPMPVGEEDKAREFYVGVLGLAEVKKPKELALRGGVWFEFPDRRQIHLQSEPIFERLRHPHPAIAVSDLDDLATRLEALDMNPRWDDRWDGVRRFFAVDPFGNRLEFVEAKAVGL